MEELAKRIFKKQLVTLVADNSEEYRISGWSVDGNTFTLDIMNMTKIRKYSLSYPQAICGGHAFQYITENNIDAIVKALVLLNDDLLF